MRHIDWRDLFDALVLIAPRRCSTAFQHKTVHYMDTKVH